MVEPDVPDFILAYGCLGPVSFEERVRSAADAGFDKIGYSVLEYQALAETGVTLDDLRRILAASNVVVAELEIALGFDAGYERAGAGESPRWGPPSFPFDVPCIDAATSDHLFAMVEALQPAHVNVLGSWGAGGSRTAERLAAFCDRAAEYDATVALEFMPGTSVPDVVAAAEVLAAADRPNVGVCFDTWHYERGPNPAAGWAELAPEQITVLQIADGPRAPRRPDDYFAETMHLRQLPGDGEWDLVGLLAGMAESGSSAPWSVEVISDDLHGLPAAQAAQHLHRSLETLAAQVRAARGQA